MAAAPVFAVTPNIQASQVSAANTNRDGTGTIVTVLTPNTNGTLIENIFIKATVTTTAGMIRFFITEGGDKRLVEEVLVAAVTASATVAAFSATAVTLKDYVLETGQILSASTEKGEAINIHVHGSDF